MQTKLTQHLAIATGALSAATISSDCRAGVFYWDETHAFSVAQWNSDTEAAWDIDGDGSTEFTLSTDWWGSIHIGTSYYIQLSPRPGRGRGWVAEPWSYTWNGNTYTGISGIRALQSAMVVGPTLLEDQAWPTTTTIGVSLLGNWVHQDPEVHMVDGIFGSNFFGFRFEAGGDLLYGWAEALLSTENNGTVTINRWAYEGTPNCGLAVGETSANNCSTGETPAPPTIALLAAGAFGLRRWRARRAAA